MTNNEIYEEAIRQWGEEAQIHQATEEMAELIVAINKCRRAKTPDEIAKRKFELCGEIADVLNCMDQMRMMSDPEIVDAIRVEKMYRLQQRLGK